jgi:hypothetical protein
MSIKRLSGAGLTTPKSNKLWDQVTFQSGMFALATVSLTTTASSIAFSSIPSGYKDLQIRVFGQETVSGGGFNNMNIYFNSDNASGNYTIHSLSGDGSTAFGQTTSSRNTALIYNALSTNTSIFGASIIDILDYGSVVKHKSIRAFAGVDFNGSGRVGLSSGLWINSSTAISTVTLTTSSFTANTFVALYGIKG